MIRMNTTITGEARVSSRKFRGGSVMSCVSFGAMGKLELAFSSSKMHSMEYQQVLQDKLVPFFKKYRRLSISFQQNNASVHASASTKACFASRKIDVLPLPACSPDMNSMENMWAVIIRFIYANNKQNNNVNELKSAIIAAWANIEPNIIINNLIASIQNRSFYFNSN